MDDWEDPDERTRAYVKRIFGRKNPDVDVEITTTGGSRIIVIKGLEDVRGPSCKRCGDSLITAGLEKRHWWSRGRKRVCPTCDPDHPVSIHMRRSMEELGDD